MQNDELANKSEEPAAGMDGNAHGDPDTPTDDVDQQSAPDSSVNDQSNGDKGNGDTGNGDKGNGDTGDDTFSPETASVSETLNALYNDGKQLLDAELAFQKSRLVFVAQSSRWGLIHAIIALGCLHMAMVALVVGLLFALAPVIGPWQALGVVAGSLMLMGIVFAWAARSVTMRIAKAFDSIAKSTEAARKEQSGELLSEFQDDMERKIEAAVEVPRL